MIVDEVHIPQYEYEALVMDETRLNWLDQWARDDGVITWTGNIRTLIDAEKLLRETAS